MELKLKPCFSEYAALVLQRTLEEGEPDLVVKWAPTVFELISRYIYLFIYLTLHVDFHLLIGFSFT